MPRGATPGAVYLSEGVRREGYCRADALRRARVITAAMFSTVCASNPASQAREARSPSESGTPSSASRSLASPGTVRRLVRLSWPVPLSGQGPAFLHWLGAAYGAVWCRVSRRCASLRRSTEDGMDDLWLSANCPQDVRR